MITFKGKTYPTRHVKLHFKEADHTADVIVSTESLNDALSEDVDNGLEEAKEVDNQIYFFIEDDQFFEEITYLDQPVEMLEEDFSHMASAIVQQMDDWNTKELFDYSKEQEMLDEDEFIENFSNDRTDLLEGAKEHREQLLSGMTDFQVLERYQKLFA